MRHLLVISNRESVFFLIVLSDQFSKTGGEQREEKWKKKRNVSQQQYNRIQKQWKQ